MIRGIAFDLFDTLVDQNHDRLPWVEFEGKRLSPTTGDLLRHAAEKRGLSISLGEFAEIQRDVDRALVRETLKQGIELPTLRRFLAFVERLGVARPEELALEFTRIHMGRLRDAVSVPAFHEPILAALAVDHRLAVCSNFSHTETARVILDEARFTPHLASIVISDEVGIRKPRPEIFLEVARSLDLEPTEILHVGDSLTADIAGAAAVGMRTVWLTRQVKDPGADLDRYEGPAPDFALEGLSDLPVLAARLSV